MVVLNTIMAGKVRRNKSFATLNVVKNLLNAATAHEGDPSLPLRTTALPGVFSGESRTISHNGV